MNFERYYNWSTPTRAQVRECEAAFKAELLETLGVAGHPKADRMFEIAWDLGHSHGYREVYIMAQDLADLLK